ncbi:unnamed protein product, partial [Mesorhabditis spiculigera]
MAGWYAWNRVRGTGYFYGEEAIEEIRRELGIQFIVRAHQVMNTGVRFFWRLVDLNLHVNEEQELLRANTREGMRFRNQIIRDVELNPEIAGILAYDGNNRMSMIHFIPTKYTYNTHADFAKAFERKAATDLGFSENSCNRPEWRTASSSSSRNDVTADPVVMPTAVAPDDVKLKKTQEKTQDGLLTAQDDSIGPAEKTQDETLKQSKPKETV